MHQSQCPRPVRMKMQCSRTRPTRRDSGPRDTRCVCRDLDRRNRYSTSNPRVLGQVGKEQATYLSSGIKKVTPFLQYIIHSHPFLHCNLFLFDRHDQAPGRCHCVRRCWFGFYSDVHRLCICCAMLWNPRIDPFDSAFQTKHLRLQMPKPSQVENKQAKRKNKRARVKFLDQTKKSTHFVFYKVRTARVLNQRTRFCQTQCFMPYFKYRWVSACFWLSSST